MRQDLAKLSSYAEAEIETLQAEGVTLTPADIIAINALAWQVETQESRRLLARGIPVSVGGVTLWPLTIYAAEWYDRVGCRMGAQATYALAFAMAHGRDDGALDIEGRAAAKAVKRWTRQLTCTDTELQVAMAQILDQDREPDLPQREDGQTMTLGELVASVVAAVGGTADYWERRVSYGHVLAVVAAIGQQNRADGRPDANDPRLRADRALGYAVERIRRRGRGN